MRRLRSDFIWNIYSQLSYEILNKAWELPYSDIEQDFKHRIMEKLKKQITQKITPSNETLNEEFNREIHFQIFRNFKDKSNGNHSSNYHSPRDDFDDGSPRQHHQAPNSNKKYERNYRSKIETFFKEQVVDSNIPPMRMIVIGDD